MRSLRTIQCKRCSDSFTSRKKGVLLCSTCNPLYAAEQMQLQRQAERDRRNFLLPDGSGGVLTDKAGHRWIVDLEDFAVAKNYLWNDNGHGYAKRGKRGREGGTRYLHKLICPQLELVDHIDRNPSNCRRNNLRDGGGGVNSCNTPRRGVAHLGIRESV